MKSLISILLLFVICTVISCSDDEMEIQEIVDVEGPVLKRVKWIDHPRIDNDPTGEILDGSHHTINIGSHFQLAIDVIDENLIVEAEVYFYDQQ